MPTKDEQEIIAEFFYNEYTRTWPQSTLEQMFPIYVNEMNKLFAALESREAYYQEFARDYRLATELRSKVSSDILKRWTHPTDARNKTPFYIPPKVSEQPYSIIPTAKGIVFKRYTKQVLTLSYRSFFNYLEHYIALLRKNFSTDMARQDYQDKLNEQRLNSLKQDLQSSHRTQNAKKETQVLIRILESSGHWEQRLENLRSLEWSKLFNKITSTLQFWKSNAIKGDPNKIYSGSKKLSLTPGALVSFKQLDCPNTLTSLTADALYNYTDLNELVHYVNLRTLALRHMHIKDISFVANLTNLDELILYNNEITDISPISNLPRLTHLYLVGNKIKDFSPLFTLPRLKTLYLDDDQIKTQKEWELLPRYVNLNIVHITPHKGRSEDGIPKFIVDLVGQRQARGHYKWPKNNTNSINNTNVDNSTENNLTQEKLAPQTQKKLSYDPLKLNIKDRYLYSGITNSLGHTPAVRYDIIKLKHLDCSNTIYLQPDHTFLDQSGDFSCLQYATSLRTLNLNDRLVNDFRFLSKCTNLKELSLARTAIDDLFPLFNLSKLQRLNLCGCEHLILDKDTLSWLLTIPNLEVDAKLSQLLYDKVFTNFLNLCQNFGITPVLRDKLSANNQALRKKHASSSHTVNCNISNFDIFDENIEDTTEQIKSPFDTLPTNEILPNELAYYFQNLTLWGFRQYLQFLNLVKEWDGTVKQSENLLWLLTPNAVLRHPISYPWLKPFNQYSIAYEKYMQDFKIAAQKQLEIFDLMLPFIYSLYPNLSQENVEEIREELKYQIKDLKLVQDYSNLEMFWDDFFTNYGIEIKDQLKELYNQFIAVQYPKRPILDKFWRNHLPFLVTYCQKNIQTAKTDTQDITKISPIMSDLIKFNNEGYTAYLIEVNSGQIYKLILDDNSKKISTKLVAPNLLLFLHNWPKLIFPN